MYVGNKIVQNDDFYKIGRNNEPILSFKEKSKYQ